MSFSFLEHTADARVECSGRDFSELLESAAEAYYAITLRERGAGIAETRRIKAAGDGREDTLVRWLQELVYLLETERFVGVEFQFDEITDYSAIALAKGYLCDPDDRADEVKSATYQQIAVCNEETGLVARFTFDL
jgi:SHS2 domain-containing protein